MTPRHVLVIDDEENICKALRRSLRRENYEVFIGCDPAEGFRILKQERIDLVISDHLMPGMTGVEFLTLVRDRYPGVMRILLTGHADMATAVRAINEGQIYRFLTKPWDDDALKAELFGAFQQLDEDREHRRLLAEARSQSDRLAVMW